jgi:hypothetical protein
MQSARKSRERERERIHTKKQKMKGSFDLPNSSVGRIGKD